MDTATCGAAVFGATGLVGGACLDLILADTSYAKVMAPGRRKPQQTAAKLIASLSPLDKLEDLSATDLPPGSDVFCCLGTTIATAGSKEAFRRVDHDYVLAAAKFAQRIGARQFLMVTAIGASARSPVFYNRTKGEAEASVTALGLPSVTIFRPSLLLGHRAEFRWKERLSEPFLRVLGIAMIGPVRRLRPIAAVDVARGMLAAARDPKPGVTIYESERIADLAHGFRPRTA